MTISASVTVRAGLSNSAPISIPPSRALASRVSFIANELVDGAVLTQGDDLFCRKTQQRLQNGIGVFAQHRGRPRNRAGHVRHLDRVAGQPHFSNPVSY